MNQALDFLLRHGYLVMFAAVSLEQMGFPVPAVPFLLGLGALSGEGRFSFWISLALAVAASLPGDLIWYELGRKRGYGVLRVLCKVSLESETCVRRTEGAFLRYGAGGLALAKFLPGLSTVAPPMAGMLKMPRWRFLLLDGLGAGLWAFAYLALGYQFRRELERMAGLASSFGSGFLIVLVAGLTVYFGWKWVRQRRFLALLMRERVAPGEVMRRLEAGEHLTLLDLRHDTEVAEAGVTLPGAIFISPAHLRQQAKDLPPDRDIILFCT